MAAERGALSYVALLSGVGDADAKSHSAVEFDGNAGGRKYVVVTLVHRCGGAGASLTEVVIIITKERALTYGPCWECGQRSFRSLPTQMGRARTGAGGRATCRQISHGDGTQTGGHAEP